MELSLLNLILHKVFCTQNGWEALSIFFLVYRKKGDNYCKVNKLDTQKIVVINTTTNNPKSQFDVAFKSPLTV